MLITIGRQYGAGGREVAEILAKELQIPLYDRKLVALIYRTGWNYGLLRMLISCP